MHATGIKYENPLKSSQVESSLFQHFLRIGRFHPHTTPQEGVTHTDHLEPQSRKNCLQCYVVSTVSTTHSPDPQDEDQI